jgi:hypothetical protein
MGELLEFRGAENLCQTASPREGTSLLRGFGLLLALTGELSWLSIVVPKAGLLIPLARWPGFIWLIATGFLITREKVVAR